MTDTSSSGGRNPSARHYFVDEAGDATLFNRKGHVIVGTRGCSRFFILGFIDISSPTTLTLALEGLRARLLADPYFRNVPSMGPQASKTAVAFHAKDDLPEVRREVLPLLLRHDVRFFAVVKDKLKVLAYARGRNERDPEYRYNPNELYDYLVRRLFKEQLHKDDLYNIYFAKRGTPDRTAALATALEAARTRFSRQWHVSSEPTVLVHPRLPPGCGGLQAVDYFLWALQRPCERGEERFVQLLWPALRLVIDMDDTRSAGYGVYYSQKRPLTSAALKGKRGI